MRYIIYGAGGIGGTIGARLHSIGVEVLLIARGEHGRQLQAQGLRFVSPSGVQQLRIPVVSHPREITFSAEDVVLLCMKSQHTVAALEDLRAASAAVTHLPIVCAQNGVSNERMALRRFRRVYAMLVQLPATHLTPGEVVTTAQAPGGVLDTGCFPQGCDDLAQTLCADLERAGFSATADASVMRKKYGKLLLNLMNAVQALLPLDALGEPEVRELMQELTREARACYTAAGIECVSKAEQQALIDQLTMEEIPGYARAGGSSWQSLMRGTGDIEVDYLNGEIVQLGRRYGVPTPANEACQRLALALAAAGGTPGSAQLEDIRSLASALA